MLNLNLIKLIKKASDFAVAFVVVGSFLVSSPEAGDGRRNGFIIGGGMVHAPYYHWSLINTDVVQTSQPSGLNFFLGWSFGEKNVLTWRRIWLSTDFESPLGSSQNFVGPKYFHYFGDLGDSYFGTVSVGYSVLCTRYTNVSSTGTAFSVGIGYEFMRHFQAELTYAHAKATNKEFDSRHNTIMLSVNVMAY